MVPMPRWNLFADVLDTLLQQHGMPHGLGHLDDRRDPLTHLVIHPQKVRRLQQSLTNANSFPTLTPEEIEQVARTFQFSAAEVVHLQAAVLATAIEAKLMDRIEHVHAWQAATLIFPIIEQAMQANQALGMIRHAPDEERNGMSDAEDRWLAPILDMIDRATIALHLSESAHTVEERLDCLHQAHAAYYAARVSLNQLAAPQQKSEAWNYWHREAVQGEALTQTQLDE